MTESAKYATPEMVAIAWRDEHADLVDRNNPNDSLLDSVYLGAWLAAEAVHEVGAEIVGDDDVITVLGLVEEYGLQALTEGEQLGRSTSGAVSTFLWSTTVLAVNGHFGEIVSEKEYEHRQHLANANTDMALATR